MAVAAERCRVIFFTGLPAAGKSFFLQQQALIAAQAGRRLHFLRWDAALAAFETDDLLKKYPETDRVSHPVIRKAAGLWSRQAVAKWEADFRRAENLLIGEVPISGNRFVELVQVHEDAAEPILAGASTAFFVPVPTNDVRRRLEAKRRATAKRPQHADEARDAPVGTMENVLREMRVLANDLGLIDAAEESGEDAYDASVYARFFLHLLRHRRSRVLEVGVLYPNVGSAHEFDVAGDDLMATCDEAAALVSALENTVGEDEITRSVENWYRI